MRHFRALRCRPTATGSGADRKLNEKPPGGERSTLSETRVVHRQSRNYGRCVSVDAVAERGEARKGQEWSRQAITELAPTMRCPRCHVVGGLRLCWTADGGQFTCDACEFPRKTAPFAD